MKISVLNLKKMAGDVFLEIRIACIYLTKVSFAVRCKTGHVVIVLFLTRTLGHIVIYLGVF